MADSVKAVFGQLVSLFDDTNFAEERRRRANLLMRHLVHSDLLSLPLARSVIQLIRKVSDVSRCQKSNFSTVGEVAPCRLTAHLRQTPIARSKKPARSADELRHRSISGTEGRKED